MIIFDSSTLLLVSKIDLLDVLLDRSPTELAIPLAVQRECCAGTKSFDELLIRQRIGESKIRVVPVRNKTLLAKFAGDFNIAAGEAEALALALQENAQLLGIDDKNGINACKLLGIPFTTAVAILLRARENGWVAKEDALTKIEALRHFGRYADAIITDARSRLERGK